MTAAVSKPPANGLWNMLLITYRMKLPPMMDRTPTGTCSLIAAGLSKQHCSCGDMLHLSHPPAIKQT
jgi:hypothetical protein